MFNDKPKHLPSSVGSCKVLPGCRWVRLNALTVSLLFWWFHLIKGHLVELIRKLKLHSWISEFILREGTFQFWVTSLNFIQLAVTQSHPPLPVQPGQTALSKVISLVGTALRVFYLAFGKKKKSFRAAWTTKLQYLLNLLQVLRWQDFYNRALRCQRKQGYLSFNLQGLQRLWNKRDKIQNRNS